MRYLVKVGKEGMNILFISLLEINSVSEHGLYDHS